jgi:hypothetical protein
MGATLTTLAKEMELLRQQLGQQSGNPTLDRLRADPAAVLTRAGYAPDAWQRAAMCSRSSRALWLCSRQSGKSLTAAALAVREAVLRPGSLVLLLSPTLRQSGELFRAKFKSLWVALGRPVAAVQESALSLELANGSRVISLPGDEATIRGYSGVRLLVVDEAARVPDGLYLAIRPMLAVSRGRLVCLSSAWAKLGWFYDAWVSGDGWERVRVTAAECPRISPDFLQEERQALGPRWYAMEYECEFGDSIDAVFRGEDIDAALSDGAVKPLFVG